MRYHLLFGKTRMTAPSDADSPNARFLIQGGFIEREAAGIYNFLPLGLRVLHKINAIIREEMNAVSGQEISMPVLHPIENWEQTGRHKTMTDILYKTKGHGDHEFILGPSHEEIVTPLAKKFIQSYKDLPLSLYQIQAKFRNEPRAKAGILRGREFGMKDMYSFHATQEDLDAYYEEVKKAYMRVYERMGLKAYVVEASGGAFSEHRSHEFSVRTPAGEDTILICEKCSFAQNLEIAEAALPLPPGADAEEKEQPIAEVSAARGPSIEEGSKLHNLPPWKILKTVVYRVSKCLLGVCIRGDLDVNAEKLAKFLGEDIRMARQEELAEAGLSTGFISPVNSRLPFIGDHSVKQIKNFCTGANRRHRDFLNANLGRDFQISTFGHFADVPLCCPKCRAPLLEEKAIEAGNIFKLGTKYTDAFDVTFSDDNGQKKKVIMGCYGIGNTRLMGTAVEASHDEHGIIWPSAIAPYQVHLLHLGAKDEVKKAAEKLYDELCRHGYEVLYDDRDESAGKKLNDADLIGIPWRVLVSEKTLLKNSAEVKKRSQVKAELIDISALEEKLRNA